MQADGDETSDIFVNLKNYELQVWRLIKIRNLIGDEVFGPNRRAAWYELNWSFHVEFRALVAKPYLTEGPRAENPTDNGRHTYFSTHWKNAENLASLWPKRIFTCILQQICLNLIPFNPVKVNYPVKLISNDLEYDFYHVTKSPFPADR